ncbi:hypothetical protein [Silvanigrella sp.]|uniref:hypothetical protein n=1 Tax=Silvanigrella sp. TaxID=2024976 RepID=UPI0037C844F7
MKLLNKLLVIFPILSLVCLSATASNNISSYSNSLAENDTNVSVNFVWGTGFLGSVCTKNGCSGLKGVTGNFLLNLSEGDKVCVSINGGINPFYGIVRSEFIFNVINPAVQSEINFWGVFWSPTFNFTTDSILYVKNQLSWGKLPCYEFDFSNTK